MKKILAVLTCLLMLLGPAAAAEGEEGLSLCVRDICLTLDGREFRLEPEAEFAFSEGAFGFRAVSQGKPLLEAVLRVTDEAALIFFPGHPEKGIEMKWSDYEELTGVPFGPSTLSGAFAMAQDRDRQMRTAIRVVRERKGIDLSGIAAGRPGTAHFGFDTDDLDALYSALYADTGTSPVAGASFSGMGIRAAGAVDVTARDGWGVSTHYTLAFTGEELSYDLDYTALTQPDGSGTVRVTAADRAGLIRAEYGAQLDAGGRSGSMEISLTSDFSRPFTLSFGFDMTGPAGVRLDGGSAEYVNAMDDGADEALAEVLSGLSADAVALLSEPSVTALAGYLFEAPDLPQIDPTPAPQGDPTPAEQGDPTPAEQAGGYLTRLPAGVAVRSEQLYSDSYGAADLVDAESGDPLGSVSFAKEPYGFGGLLAEGGAAAPGESWYVRADSSLGSLIHVNAVNSSFTVDMYLYRSFTLDEIYTILSGICMP